ncbi:single-stranded-DNA-specific exonuclease RecJ [Leptolyngbya sp. AN02str]|uniref:single-stranded-DNA-specific exonuclease RecJ n=1 Tax=Leptolyngbya sp. AN02str TaxID=3423363 RepID=UPI003D3227F7
MVDSSVSPQFNTQRLPRQRWQIASALGDRAFRLADRVGLHPLLAQVLLNRGIETPQQAAIFLDPELQELPSALEEFPDLAIALEQLQEAIEQGWGIAICGDYDADGMTSTALLLRALRALDAQVDYAIPSRMQEGYGINRRIVEEFYNEGVRLILTVDNGIAAYEPIAYARELGMVVIVTDHHDIPPMLPPANAILNPKLIREDSPFRGVAGVGVAYILAVYLAQCFNKNAELTNSLLELFTLGTIADLAPLTGVNRRWVRRGLALLPKSKLAGVQALIQVAGLSNEQNTLKPEAIGFRLGPRINAVGRIGNPQLVIDMLTTDDPGIALERAMQCEEVNQLRQRMCELIEQEAIAYCEAMQFDLPSDRVLVVVQPNWHHGVIGIVASRLVERYGVPVFIGTYEDEAQTHVRGSARGIPEFNVFDGLQCCADILEKFGGHRAAGGFSLQAEYLDEMRSRLRIFANMHLQPQHLKPLVTIDAQANLEDLNLELYAQIDRLHPCGIENGDPVFWTPNVRVVEQQTIGQNRAHLKLTVAQAQDGSDSMKAIAWRWGEYCPLPSRVDIAYKLRLNEWNGVRSVELELVGVRLPHGEEPVVAALREDVEDGDRLMPPESAERSSPFPPEGVPFTFSKRRYHCTILMLDGVRELHIRNAEGGVLVIQPKQRVGRLLRQSSDVQLVELSHPFYADLMQAALNALQVAEKDDLLKKKDRIIAEKNAEIQALTQQLEALMQQTAQVSQSAPVEAAAQSSHQQPHEPPGELAEDAIAQTVPLGQPFPVAVSSPSENLAIAPSAAIEDPAVGVPPADRSDDSPAQPEPVAEVSVSPPSDLLVNKAIETSSVEPSAAETSSAATSSAATSSAETRSDETSSPEIMPAPPAELAALNVEPLPPITPVPVVSTPVEPPPEPDALQQILKTHLGSSVWFCLDERSQKALVRSQLLFHRHEQTGAQDYSEAGDRLCAVVSREVVQPFFSALYEEAVRQNRATVGMVSLEPKKRYTFDLVAPLVANQWETFRESALQQPAQPPNAILYWTVTPAQLIPAGDREFLRQFLQTWEHPLGEWFLEDLEASASVIDQAHKLHHIVTDPEIPLVRWQFDLLRSLVVGDDLEHGMLQEIYAPRQMAKG